MSPTALPLVMSLLLGQVGEGEAPAIVQPPVVQPPIGKPAPPIVRPVPVPVQAKWELSVQEESQFDEKQWGAASEPASTKGLQLVVQPERKSFAGNGPLAFRVTLKNVSEKPILLAGGPLGGEPRLVMAHQKTGAQWTLEGDEDEAKPTTVAPGKTVSYTVLVENSQVFVQPPIPVPVPLPGPVPRPLPPGKIQPLRKAAPAALQAAQPVPPARDDKRRPQILPPVRPPVFIGPIVPVGQGTVRAQLFVEFEKTEGQPKAWTGRIASKPVEFEVGKPEPIPQPGVPTSKKQAIRTALPVAERALQVNYQPVAGVQPVHTGKWIENAEKTARVTETKTGWRVSWTHTPPRGGFGYNVTVEVNRGGGAVVREVFTSHTRR